MVKSKTPGHWAGWPRFSLGISFYMDVMVTCSNKSSSLVECQFGKFRSKMVTPFPTKTWTSPLKYSPWVPPQTRHIYDSMMLQGFCCSTDSQPLCFTQSFSMWFFCTIEEFKVGATAKLFFQSQQGPLTHRVQTPLAAAPEAWGWSPLASLWTSQGAFRCRARDITCQLGKIQNAGIIFLTLALNLEVSIL